MTFDSLVIYASLVTAIISMFVFAYSTFTSKRGYPDVTGTWTLSLSVGPSCAYDVIKGKMIIKRQFLGELHGVIETETSITTFKGTINRHGMIQCVYGSPDGISGNLMLLLKTGGLSAEGQYMTAGQGGHITQGYIFLERAANKNMQSAK
ncbi:MULTISPECIES: hypothetical protein [Aeromonas]|uniref:hypothetical protein n=1 Tax=Aeromonas TaxID=642 RepID=UPI0015EB5958|nr:MULTISPECIES: hypothetical protein [Aeromonas]MBA2799155.1 hypothetical protein [Aeromonas veronii]MBL0489666.1 hypothetical protein [Aeromonas veronii]QXB98533.1 hypothetical protein I6L48_16120 [Aeromonas sp. FDAARGOS 1418]UBR47133.1 hypothetical protein LAG74_08525 [Aeromonas veronii]